ncbi:hypothetical protein ACO0RG_000790 [Hanseniaspora osmophila]|uniref:Transcription initiation factor IIE subunit beta n=1 Tax=Hanseniaspora osmophila TaxID=56408 RepID=A0A1E5R147_9ASCO|nr:Transcription initiation factor IIE subunit beta [Hanseniaspora osmophila]
MSSLLDNLNKIKNKLEVPSTSTEPSKDNTPLDSTQAGISIKRERSDVSNQNDGDAEQNGEPVSKKMKSSLSANGDFSDDDGEDDDEASQSRHFGDAISNGNKNNNGSSSGSLASSLNSSQNGPGLSGTHLSTKLLLATEYIQDRGGPVSIAQIESYLSLKPESPEANNVIQLLKNINKIKFDPEEKTLQYVSIYDIHTAQDLIELLRKQPVFKGISVKELKDGWPKCNEVLDDLEKRGRVLVLRTKKDGTARYVWYNSYKMPEKIRGNIVKNLDENNPRPYQQFIAEDFRNMWEDVKLPSRADIPRKLTDLGLKPASVDPASVIKKGTITRVEVKRRKQRKSKITNTHMTGMLKDYSDRV